MKRIDRRVRPALDGLEGKVLQAYVGNPILSDVLVSQVVAHTPTPAPSQTTVAHVTQDGTSNTVVFV